MITHRKPLSREHKAKIGQANCGRTTSPVATERHTRRGIDWAAGFLEGEGSFTGGRSHRVSASQVEMEPLLRLARMFGGSIQNYLQTDKRNRINVWTATGSRGRGIMLTLYGLMSRKRKAQIRKAIA